MPTPPAHLRHYHRPEQPGLDWSVEYVGQSWEEAAAAPYCYPRHQHLEHELIVPARGTYRCQLNGVDLTLDPGEALLVAPGDWHQECCAPPLSLHALWFHVRACAAPGAPQRLLVAPLPPARQRLRVDLAEVEPTLARMQAETRRGDAAAAVLLGGLASALVATVTRLFPDDALAPPFRHARAPHRLPYRLRQLFERQQGASLSVAAMARQLGMSASALAHQCRAEGGVSPARAQLLFKVEKARELLRHTGMSVKEVSAYLGFANPYHFSRVVKMVTGQSPVRFKQP